MNLIGALVARLCLGGVKFLLLKHVVRIMHIPAPFPCYWMGAVGNNSGI